MKATINKITKDGKNTFLDCTYCNRPYKAYSTKTITAKVGDKVEITKLAKPLENGTTHEVA